MFIAAQFTIAKTWKQPKCPSTDDWIKKFWHCRPFTRSFPSVMWLPQCYAAYILLCCFASCHRGLGRFIWGDRREVEGGPELGMDSGLGLQLGFFYSECGPGPIGNPLNKPKGDASGDQPPGTRTVAPGTHCAERGDPGRAGSISATESPRVLGYSTKVRSLRCPFCQQEAPKSSQKISLVVCLSCVGSVPPPLLSPPMEKRFTNTCFSKEQAGATLQELLSGELSQLENQATQSKGSYRRLAKLSSGGGPWETRL
ncbi:LINE-1 retrotransposable element ORF2 protein [Camelus dromedarius]|uniref:LINE-1 retrotransposable element ORF2 protein n=1 Tax=Camelus dromedarius TaxID=9838 RepID=A0A5N4E9I0_CAMDR|nr:LINE-1 retrotransposable element ORF2 protein [Camelus dromedarius]